MALSRVPGDDEIYVGGMLGLRRQSTLQTLGITHLVSVLKFDFREVEGWESYEHLNIGVDDVQEEALLGEFERTGAFIEEALRSGTAGRPGRVLIHCAMGKSRSATVCVAYLLRQYPNHSVASALALLRQARPMVEPNPGFMAQLELYKDMGCPRDIDQHPQYQRWLYQRHVESAIAAGTAPETLRFEDEHDEETRKQELPGGKVELRCRKCRKVVATTDYLLAHQAPGIFDCSNTSATPQSHTHHFIQPLSWMRPILSEGQLSGRLDCPNPKCSAQIGRYAWQGMKCSCGVWVCPAFSLAKSKIDAITVRSAPRPVHET